MVKFSLNIPKANEIKPLVFSPWYFNGNLNGISSRPKAFPKKGLVKIFAKFTKITISPSFQKSPEVAG